MSFLKIFTHHAHIHLHHHLEYRIELKLDVYFEKTLKGELQLSKDIADVTSFRSLCAKDKYWKSGLQNVPVKWNSENKKLKERKVKERANTGETEIDTSEVAADIYYAMILAVQKANRSLEEFQADVTIWYFLEKYINFGKSQFETETKDKQPSEGSSSLTQLQTVQELKHIAMHTLFIMMPCWLIYLFCMVMFTTRIKERGIPDYGNTGMFTTNFLQDLGKYSTLLIVVTNFASAYRHKIRENLRLHQAEIKSKLAVYHQLHGAVTKADNVQEN